MAPAAEAESDLAVREDTVASRVQDLYNKFKPPQETPKLAVSAPGHHRGVWSSGLVVWAWLCVGLVVVVTQSTVLTCRLLAFAAYCHRRQSGPR